MPAKLFKESLRQFTHALMEGLADGHNLSFVLLLDVCLLQKLVGYTHQSIVWPGLEPIDGAAVDERGELTKAVSESVSNRTESNDYVEIFPAAVDKESKECQGGEVCIFVSRLSNRSHSLHNFGLFIGGKEVRHFTCVEQGVN